MSDTDESARRTAWKAHHLVTDMPGQYQCACGNSYTTGGGFRRHRLFVMRKAEEAARKTEA